MPVYVIGIDEKANLLETTRSLIEKSDLIIGTADILMSFADMSAEKAELTDNLDDMLNLLTKNTDRFVSVLTRGDPLFFNIGRFLTNNIPKESIEIIPSVSIMQTAFSKIKEPWDDAAFMTLEANSIASLINKLRYTNKIFVFTCSENSPDKIASELAKQGMSDISIHVFENAGQKNEKITSGTIFEIATQSFSEKNCVILIRTGAIGERARLGLGIPDYEFYQIAPNQVIPSEVRAVCLAKLGLDTKSVVWDIGAGCGSVSIEACFLARQGGVYSIENNNENIECLRKNIDKFRPRNIKVIQGTAPDCYDAIFENPESMLIQIDKPEILTPSVDRLGENGKFALIVKNLSQLERLSSELRKLNCNFDSVLLNVSRGKSVQDKMYLSALDPFWIIFGTKS